MVSGVGEPVQSGSKKGSPQVYKGSPSKKKTLKNTLFPMVLGIADPFQSRSKKGPHRSTKNPPAKKNVEKHNVSNGFGTWGPFSEQV